MDRISYSCANEINDDLAEKLGDKIKGVYCSWG